MGNGARTTAPRFLLSDANAAHPERALASPRDDILTVRAAWSGYETHEQPFGYEIGYERGYDRLPTLHNGARV